MIIRKHTEMRAWQFAKKLERRVFALLATRAPQKDADFCRQIRNSARSAPRNMAEGFGRFWPAEFAHKLRIAIGELQETGDHLGEALEQNYLDETAYDEMIALADRAIGAAVKFAEYLDQNGEAWKKAYRARKREEGRRKRAEREQGSHGVEEQNTSPNEEEPESRRHLNVPGPATAKNNTTRRKLPINSTNLKNS
jgi:four helix bundle protein